MMKLSMIKLRNIFKAIAVLVACLAMNSCSNHQDLSAINDGYNDADSIVSGIGDARDYGRVIAVTDSFERVGMLTPVRAIFYKTIAYNLMGQHRAALRLYYQLAKIKAKDLKTQADIDSYTYSAKDYVRMLCNMRRYDRALREAYNADRKLKEVGQEAFVDNHEIAQMIGECQLYLDQGDDATKSFQKSLEVMQARLAAHTSPLELRLCQKTMNAIARALISRGRYDEAAPWIVREDSLLAVADTISRRDSVYVDEMKADISYSKALLAVAQGHTKDGERAFAEYQTTQTAKRLSRIIGSSEYLMKAHRYDEAARNYTKLDQFLQESGYKADLENIGRYMIPKYRANLLAGNRDTALMIATKVAEYYDTALVRQKMNDADLLSTIYDTEGKERQIAEQRAELSQQRMILVAVVTVIIFIFFNIYGIQRRRAFRKLSATNKQLKRANELAEESARIKSQFIHQISHEVRTPLNVLSGFSQVLANPDIDIDANELQSISSKIVENSERITHLVDKMLELSLVNSDATIECSDKVSVADVARQAVKESHIEQADHLDFRLRLPTEAEQPTFVTNQKAAVKALVLLLDNAIKFTHPLAFTKRRPDYLKALVTLSVKMTDEMVVFAVEDTGIGIPSNEAEHIFSEYVQLDEYTDGTGIGLSIARSLARHMQGDINLDITYTSGARFVMSLPHRKA